MPSILVTPTKGLFQQAGTTTIPAGSLSGHKSVVETVTTSTALTVADSHKYFLVGTDALVITLPSTAAGVKYTFINSGADQNNIITISPAAADKIIGTVANASADSVATASDNGDLVLTKNTANRGDRVTLVGDGVDGWYIVEGVGIWVGA